MRDSTQDQDLLLVAECLSGSERAWERFWMRYRPLVRAVVMDQGILWKANQRDTDDVVQEVFVDLLCALERFDGEYPLHKFVAGVAKRTSRGRFRGEKAAKRDGRTNPVDHHDGSEEGFIRLRFRGDSAEELLIHEQRKQILREGLWALDPECLKLVTLRHYEGRAFADIAEQLGAKENTVTVKTARCLEKLKANCHEITRKGCRK